MKALRFSDELMEFNAIFDLFTAFAKTGKKRRLVL